MHRQAASIRWSFSRGCAGPRAAASRASRGLRLLATGLLLCAAGCSNLVRALPELDFNPLIRVEHQPDGAVEVEALGPLVALRAAEDGLSHAVRPLYQHKRLSEATVTDVLAPLGRSFTNRSGTKYRLWPLLWAGETTDTPAGTDWQFVLFPFILAGNGPAADDGYFALWPLAGRTRRVFGVERWDFVLWPLFMRMRMDVTEPSESWTVLLIFGWTSGGPRDGSWRALPFYRHRLWRTPDGELRIDQKTAPWPFVTWGLGHGDSAAPSQRFALWPLWSRETSAEWQRTTVLWPFFRYNTSLVPAVEEGGDFFYDLPWPFFRFSRSPQNSTFRIFPFYSHQSLPSLDSTSFLWPFGWWRIQHGYAMGDRDGQPEGAVPGSDTAVPVELERRTFLFAPFVRHSRRTLAAREGTELERQVWPLLHADEGLGGRRDRGLFSLVPGRNLELLRAADELYSPFWSLWRERSDGERHETRLLFDLCLWRREPAGLRVSIPLLYARRPEAEGVARHQVLWGLAGARTDDDGFTALSVLGFDLWTR